MISYGLGGRAVQPVALSACAVSSAVAARPNAPLGNGSRARSDGGRLSSGWTSGANRRAHAADNES